MTLHSEIEKLIEVHQRTVDLCRTMVEDRSSGIDLSGEAIAAISNEAGCEFTKILKAGNFSFDGAIAEEAVVALHGTFHSIASLILALVKTNPEGPELSTYVAALNSVSSQLITVLRAARVH